MTVAQLAEKIGLSAAVVSRIETGKRGLKVETLKKIAKVYGVSHERLLKAPPPDAKYHQVITTYIDTFAETIFFDGEPKYIRLKDRPKSEPRPEAEAAPKPEPEE